MGGLRLRLLNGFGTSLLAALAACGGRSSTLDPDSIGFSPNQPSGGSAADPGAGGSAATPSVGTSGTSSVGNGGQPVGGNTSNGAAGGAAQGGHSASGGSTSIEPDIIEACTRYCNAQAQGPCPEQIPRSNCVASCEGELLGRGPQCRSIARSLLGCLSMAYESSSTCLEPEQLIGAKCSNWLAGYRSCADDRAPEPVPMPKPSTQLTCSSSGNSSNGKCNLDVKCTNGAAYSVRCYETSPDQSNCSCDARLPNGTGSGAGFGLNEGATFACYDSLATCGFPQIGAP